MKAESVRLILKALHDHHVHYLVAGGLAVNAYGFLRYTRDADLAIELVPDNILEAFAALASLGYHPNVPISAEQFADASLRESWIQDKNMQVLQFWSDAHRETPVDVFISLPFDFETEAAAAPAKSLKGIGDIPFVTLATLIRMKEAANREQDRIDLDHLRLLQQREDKSHE